MRSDRSVVSMVGTMLLRRVEGVRDVGRRRLLAFHCLAPAGLLVSSHSFSNRFLKKRLLQRVGVCVQVTSGPPVMRVGAVALAVACSSSPAPGPRGRRASGSGPTSDGSPAPWVLPKRVAARDQRHGLLVVHRHAEERLADVLGGSDRVRVAVGAFRVDVDQAHLHRAERLRELALAAVALVAEPGAFRTPVELLGLRRRRGRPRSRRS